MIPHKSLRSNRKNLHSSVNSEGYHFFKSQKYYFWGTPLIFPVFKIKISVLEKEPLSRIDFFPPLSLKDRLIPLKIKVSYFHR